MKTLDGDSNFLATYKNSLFDDSAIVIIPAPYEHTVSYGGGTASGPQAILEASAYVEFYDDEYERELCFDKGIATLEPLDFKHAVDGSALQIIEESVRQALEKQKFVVTLGGEHTISAAPIRAHFDFYPDMSVLQFDAHSDLRDSYQGSAFSHASVMARVAEFLPADRITQVGIRALCKEEAEYIKEFGVHTFYASAIRGGVHGDDWQHKVVQTLSDNVYITFDVDYFDPSIMPATGTPEPNGFFYAETLDILNKIVLSGKKIVGFDIVELAPIAGLHHPNLTTARLLYKMANIAWFGGAR